MITWTKEPKLLDERPQPFDYKESRIGSIKMTISKTINLW